MFSHYFEVEHNNGITYQNHYKPNCPICGAHPQENELDFELTYACGHYVGVYNEWSDGSTDEDYQELIEEATHLIITSHELGGTNYWFFNDGYPKICNDHDVIIDQQEAILLMDDELREKLHMELAPCSEIDFLNAYAKAHQEKFGTEWELVKPNPVY